MKRVTTKSATLSENEVKSCLTVKDVHFFEIHHEFLQHDFVHVFFQLFNYSGKKTKNDYFSHLMENSTGIPRLCRRPPDNCRHQCVLPCPWTPTWLSRIYRIEDILACSQNKFPRNWVAVLPLFRLDHVSPLSFVGKK